MLRAGAGTAVCPAVPEPWVDTAPADAQRPEPAVPPPQWLDAFCCDVVALHSFTVASVPVQFFFFDFSCFFPRIFIYHRPFLREVAEAPTARRPHHFSRNSLSRPRCWVLLKSLCLPSLRRAGVWRQSLPHQERTHGPVFTPALRGAGSTPTSPSALSADVKLFLVRLVQEGPPPRLPF